MKGEGNEPALEGSRRRSSESKGDGEGCSAVERRSIEGCWSRRVNVTKNGKACSQGLKPWKLNHNHASGNYTIQPGWVVS